MMNTVRLIGKVFSRKVIFGLGLLIAFVLTNPLFASAKSLQAKPKVILDADMDSDIDDMGALAMLLNLHKAGTIDLIGIVITSDDPYAPACTSAMTSFYQLPAIPIGFLKDQSKLINHSRYTKLIADEFPHQLNSWQDAEEATALYRRLLEQNAKESIVIVTIGHLTSLQRLLQSRSDNQSPLSGKELVKQKVSKWICMGGQFPEGKEANFYRPDPLSTVYCVENWEKEVVFCGWEIGNKVITGGNSLKQALSPGHPLYRGYELYNNFAGRPSWDQIAVVLLAPQSDSFFNYHRGKCLVEEDGSNRWHEDISGGHKYAILRPSIDVDSVSSIIDRLMIGRP